MIKKLLFLSSIVAGCQAENVLQLKSIKSTEHHMSLSRDFLLTIKKLTHVENFVETGTARGETSAAAEEFFEVHTIEIDRKLSDFCKNRFKNLPRVTVYQGDSVQRLPEILKKLKKPALFWLDGHHSPGFGKSDVNTPLLQELSLIKKYGHANSVILIDDIRCALWQHNDWEKLRKQFGPRVKDYFNTLGVGWPSLKQIIKAVKDINPRYEIFVMGDVLIALNSALNINVSKDLKAISDWLITWNGNQDKSALVGLEKVISQATDVAFKSIKEQTTILDTHELSCYHAHFNFWYGLMLMHRKDYKGAVKEFKKAEKGGIAPQRVSRYIAKCVKK